MALCLLRLWVWIPLVAWTSVCCQCCVLLGRGLCEELITRPEESYQLWGVIVCYLVISWMCWPWPTGGLLRKKKNLILDLSSVWSVLLITIILHQLCTNPGCQVTMAYKFCMVMPNIVGPQCGTCFMLPFWQLEYLRWVLDFWQILLLLFLSVNSRTCLNYTIVWYRNCTIMPLCSDKWAE
jgi:hypothetical protein